jgi:NHS family xanthosine MFS transporter
MLMSMFAWVLRFGLFGAGSPVGLGLVAIILSMIVYGMAFDFFNISGSLFVENEADPKIRASAQGLFLIMTNGFGSMIGAYGSGVVVDMFRDSAGIVNWSSVWYVFAGYALIIGLLFMLIFKYKHNPEKIQEIKH